MTTTFSLRPTITTVSSLRTGPQSDLGYFQTQSGILNDNSGNRILFNTGVFYPAETNWSNRVIPL